MAYIIGNRNQITFLPPTIENYIAKDDPVRAYDAFVEALDFTELGIVIDEKISGANPYWPKAMLKLWVYGYSYGIRSSRKLERACNHNLSFIWLSGGLKPDYRTIARFRSENKEALKKVLKQCVKMCIKLGLIEGNTLFVDGTKIKANASLKNTWTEKDCEKYLEEISKNIEDIMTESERIDQQEENSGSLIKLKEELQNQEILAAKIKEIAGELKASGDTYTNTTDPDSIKSKSDRGAKMYHNSQITVDGENGFIVTADVVSQENDANQLNNQVKQAQETLGKVPENVCADSSYHSVKDIEKIEPTVAVIVPAQAQVAKERCPDKAKLFSKDMFHHDKERDCYICPENKELSRTELTVINRPESTVYKACARECKQCKHFGLCTTSSSGRKIIRMKNEALLQRLSQIYMSAAGKSIYKLRKQKVELPFAHIKQNLNFRQFFLRGIAGANAELALCACGYNLTRMLNILGVQVVKTALQNM